MMSGSQMINQKVMPMMSGSQMINQKVMPLATEFQHLNPASPSYIPAKHFTFRTLHTRQQPISGAVNHDS